MRLKPGARTALYYGDFPSLWAPKFLERKIAVFTRGPRAVAFKPQGPEGGDLALERSDVYELNR